MSTLETSSFEIPNQSGDALRQCASHPADEAALLITCLRELPCEIPEDMDWEVLLGVAEANGVLLLVHQQLLAFGADMPGFFLDAVRETRSAAESLGQELEALLQEFTEHGIEALPLKGPALGLALYGDAAMRQSTDIDVLVRREDFPRAEALLLRRGFAGLGEASEHDRRFLRGELLVELHFELATPRFFPFDIDDIWSRSRRADFHGQPARAMSNTDLALFLCAHGLKHGFSRLIWILDVARALRGWQPRDYQELVRQAQRQNLEPWLLIGCEVVREMFPQLLPAALDEAIATSPAALERARHAAARLFSEDHEIVINDYRRFYLQAEPNPIRRWRYRLRYIAPTYTDQLWARHHRINPWLMLIVRPFRLLKKYGIPKIWQIMFPSKA